MNLVQKIFNEYKGDREKAFLTISYAIANTVKKAKRMQIFDDLLDLIEKEEEAVKNFKTGNIFCACGNSIDPEDMQNFCEDCLTDQNHKTTL